MRPAPDSDIKQRHVRAAISMIDDVMTRREQLVRAALDTRMYLTMLIEEYPDLDVPAIEGIKGCDLLLRALNDDGAGSY